MGCFLLLTERDFHQLNSTMKQAISVLPPTFSGGVRVQVSGLGEASAHAMAAALRQVAPTAERIVPTAKDVQRALPTLAAFTQTVAMLSPVSPSLMWLYRDAYATVAKSAMGIANYRKGYAGQDIAAQILVQHHGLTIHHITNSTGPDITASGRGGNSIIVEVKTTNTNDSFADLLTEGAGKFKECTDDWLHEVNVDPVSTTILGVRLDASRGTVSIYRRLDAEAKHWKCLLREAPLSQFNLMNRL